MGVKDGRVVRFHDESSEWSGAPLWLVGDWIHERVLERPGSPPWELGTAFQLAVDAGLDVRAVEIGPTRDFTRPLDLVEQLSVFGSTAYSRRACSAACGPELQVMSEVYDYFQQGRRHLKKGMAAQATVPLEKAKRREPNKASIRESLGIAYFRIGRYDEAAAEFRAILELAPNDDYAHYALGRCLEKQGHAAEANGHYKLAARCGPGRSSTPRASATSTTLGSDPEGV